MPAGDVETFHRAGKWFNKVEGEVFAVGPFPTRADAEAAGLTESRRWGGHHVIRDERAVVEHERQRPRS
ncbi:DUF2188 domain-containing protein [Planctomonas sp. JC2975]|uniref:DUF2188 domain-containing protein n=1 Tax=Planctomonas sp. JC2975 TaxID=2729626 RepID=UPI00147353E9|nr:DUF2188 domain-containing protein [Planctomonas sp. JC2975]NNC11024.1 DUF2188 domain-containing protein [Planctomonas sp. JC2975]